MPVDAGKPSVVEHYIRVSAAQTRDLAADLLRMPEVIGVDRRQKWAFGKFQSAIAGGGNATILLPVHRQARVCGRMALSDEGRGVRRTVVDDEYLEIPVGLSTDT